MDIPGPPAVENREVIHLAKLVKIELDSLNREVDRLHRRLDSLGSSVPPGSESEVRGERLSETVRRMVDVLNRDRERLQGELDAANQHVKILEADRNSSIASCLRACAQSITENRMEGPAAANYLDAYAHVVLKAPVGGPRTPDLAAQPDSTPKERSIEFKEKDA